MGPGFKPGEAGVWVGVGVGSGRGYECEGAHWKAIVEDCSKVVKYWVRVHFFDGVDEYGGGTWQFLARPMERFVDGEVQWAEDNALG